MQALRSASPIPVVVDDDRKAAEFEGVAIYLLEAATSTAVWEVRVFAHSAEGKACVAQFQTLVQPSTVIQAAVPGARCIAIVGAGADHYSADFRRVTGTAAGQCAAWLEPRVSCKPGIVFPNERWAVMAGINGLVSVPAGFRVQEIGALSTAGGSVQVGAVGVPVTIVAGSAVTLSPEGKLLGPVDILFTATDSYVVELTYG